MILKKSIMNDSKQILRKLGVYGFDHLELVILASLVSEDPLLLIGKAGTGKTYLLNSISEALTLDHRHYNASFLSFDDLVGFPYPDANGKAITFLKTPATIWNAESVLIDELSRCKPEVQNKFFSIIHEKKIQGIELENLKYRWAAMNPVQSVSGDSDDLYEGSFPLDQALADRFAFIIEVPDWSDLSKEEQDLVIHPAGEGAISVSSMELSQLISTVRPKFLQHILNPSAETIAYSRIISTLLGEEGFRISPRRARLLARNFTALFLVASELGYVLDLKRKNQLYKLGLRWSLPQRAWKGDIPDHVIDSAHAEGIRMVTVTDLKTRWLSEFLITPSIPVRIEMMMNDGVDKETKSLAVMQMISQDSMARTAAFAFSAQPVIESRDLLNEEALNELTAIAIKIMNVDGKLEWRESIGGGDTVHPQWSACVQYINTIKASRQIRINRAYQFFLYLLCNNSKVSEPELMEKELNECFRSAENYIVKKVK
jgi:MoxR-like ATPase